MNAPNVNALTVATDQGAGVHHPNLFDKDDDTAQVSRKANFLKPCFETIPDELKLQRWAVWAAEPRPGKSGKFNKAPRNPTTGRKFGADKAELSGTFAEAKAAYKTGRYTGVGILLTGNGVIGVDIDNYVDTFKSNSLVEAWVTQAVAAGAYCEKSPSGEGLRLFMRGKLPDKGRKSGPLEIYDNARFLTVTGQLLVPMNGDMGAELIQGQQLVDAFLGLLPEQSRSPDRAVTSGGRTGSRDQSDIAIEVQLKLPPIFGPNPSFGGRYRDLFQGDTSAYGYDHSAADMALAGFTARQGCTPDEVDLVFRASRLYRPKWDEMRGATTYGQRTIETAFEGLTVRDGGVNTSAQNESEWWTVSNLSDHRPFYVSGGMPPRKFVGPEVGPRIRLFPVAALSTLVALGAVGKTSLLMSIAAHVAAGKDWNGHSVEQRKAAMFSCEETKDELARKFSAIVDGWSPAARQAAIDVSVR